MTINDYAKKLMRLNGPECSACKCSGAKCFVLMLVLAGFGVACLLCPHIAVQAAGVFLLGCVFGFTVAGVRSHLVAARRWSLQKELYDWAKIESLAKEESSGQNG